MEIRVELIFPSLTQNSNSPASASSDSTNQTSEESMTSSQADEIYVPVASGSSSHPFVPHPSSEAGSSFTPTATNGISGSSVEGRRTRTTGTGTGKKRKNLKKSSNKEAIQAAPKVCEAGDRWNEYCTELVSLAHAAPRENGAEGKGKGKAREIIVEEVRRERLYCVIHEEEERVLREDYLQCVEGLLEDDVDAICQSEESIEASDDLAAIESWGIAIRHRYGLAVAVEDSMRYRETRYPNSIWPALPPQIDPTSIADKYKLNIALLDARSHQLILESEDAEWLITAPSPHPPCHSISTSSLRPPSAPSLQPESEEPNPLTALDRVHRLEILELLSLTGSHASFLKSLKKSGERVRIIECLFRRLIARDPILLVRAFRPGHDHVLRFFEDPLCCSLLDLTRIWAGLQRVEVEDIQEAITDAFRAIRWEESGAGETEEGAEGLGIQLLGGWIYKDRAAGQEMTREEWGHFYDLCGCSGCALRCCSTFEEWARLRRLTIVGSPPPYLYWGESKETDASKIFRAVGMVKCCEDRMMESEVKRVGGAFVGSKGKGMFIERQERNWVFVKMSIDNEKAIDIISAIAHTHAILVRDRRYPDNPLDYTLASSAEWDSPSVSSLWYSRHRSASTKSDLRHQPWQIDLSAFTSTSAAPPSMTSPPSSAILISVLSKLSTPEVMQQMAPFQDVYEILILDSFGREGEGSGRTANSCVRRSYEQFEAALGGIICEALQLENVKEVLEYSANEEISRGEMLLTEEMSPTVASNKLVKGKNGKKKEKGAAEMMLEDLRDDALAFKLSRSLFR